MGNFIGSQMPSKLGGTDLVQGKILFLFDNFELSGADRVAMDVAKALSDHGFQVELAVCMDVKGGFGDIPEKLIRLSPSSVLNESFFRRVWRGAVALIRCVSLARTVSIIVCVTPPAAFVGSIASRFSGACSIPWVHYDLAGVLREPLAVRGIARGLVQRFFYRYAVPFHRHMIFVSEASRWSMAQLTNRGVVPPGWIILPNIVDACGRACRSHESKTFARVTALREEGNRILLFIGRITRQKRWEDLVSAAECLDRQCIAYKLVIIGDGPERSALECAMRKSTSKNIEYLGADPNPMPTLAIADVLVLTSLYEAWPTVILEAFQLGVPVISYDCPSGPREMLDADPARGYLVAETPEAICVQATALLSAQVELPCANVMEAREFARRFEPNVVSVEWERYLNSIYSNAHERRMVR